MERDTAMEQKKIEEACALVKEEEVEEADVDGGGVEGGDGRQEGEQEAYKKLIAAMEDIKEEELADVNVSMDKEEEAREKDSGLVPKGRAEGGEERPEGEEAEDDSEQQAKVQRAFRELQFVNPGKKVNVAEVSGGHRVRREAAAKAAQKMTKGEKKGKNYDRDSASPIAEEPYHDELGRLVCGESKSYLCDCLMASCPGCHWNCRKCGSRRCSSICQRNRPFALLSTTQGSGGKNDKIRVSNQFLK